MPDAKPYDIQIKNFPEIPVFSIRKKIIDTPDEIASLMETTLGNIISRGGNCSGPPLVLYYEDNDFNTMEVDLEVAWPVPDKALANKVLPPIDAATLVEHLNSDGNLEEAYKALYAWITKIGCHPAHPIRETYNTDPDATSPEQLKIEIIIPIKKEHG